MKHSQMHMDLQNLPTVFPQKILNYYVVCIIIHESLTSKQATKLNAL